MYLHMCGNTPEHAKKHDCNTPARNDSRMQAHLGMYLWMPFSVCVNSIQCGRAHTRRLSYSAGFPARRLPHCILGASRAGLCFGKGGAGWGVGGGEG